jgi:hypothetical protein
MHPASALYTPVAEYIPGADEAPTSLAFTIRGTAWGLAGSNVISATNETLTFTSTNTLPLTLSWRTITNIACSSNRPNSNDAIRITYRVLPPLYDYNIGWRLTPESLNERRACINAMVATYRKAPYVKWYSSNTNSGISADGTKAWATVTAEAEADWPVPVNHAIWGTVANFGWAYYYGFGLWQDVSARLENYGPWGASNLPATAAFSYTADYYWYAKAVIPRNITRTGNVFHAWGTPLRQDQFAKVGSNVTECVGTAIMGSTVGGTLGTNIPLPWCSDPRAHAPSPPDVTYYSSSYGYNIHVGLTSPGLVIYQWAHAGTNGFKYR